MPVPREPDLHATLHRALQILWRRKWYLLVVSSAVLALTAIWTARQPRIYRAFTAIIVDQQSPNVLGKKVHDVVDISPYAYRETEDYLNTQLAIACSSAVFQNVTRSLAIFVLLTVAMVYLWSYLGPSALAGLAALVLLMISNAILVSYVKTLQVGPCTDCLTSPHYCQIHTKLYRHFITIDIHCCLLDELFRLYLTFE